MNFVAKLFFTSYTYILPLADVLSSKCLELENFPWVTVYIFANRIAIIGDITTFLCMSISKVILNWRADIYVKLNNPISVNLATVLVVLVNVVDMLIRFDMHILDDCGDSLVFKIYQVEFQRKFCLPDGYNYTSNLTVCEIYQQAENVKSIGCKICPSNPTLRIILGLILLLEIIKFFLGFARISKKYWQKLGISSKNSSTDSTQTKKTIISNNKIEPNPTTSFHVGANSTITNLTDIVKESHKDPDTRIPVDKEIFTVQAEINVISQLNDEIITEEQIIETTINEDTKKTKLDQIEKFEDKCQTPEPNDQSEESSSFQNPKFERQNVELEKFKLKRQVHEKDQQEKILLFQKGDLSKEEIKIAPQTRSEEVVVNKRKSEKNETLLVGNDKRYLLLNFSLYLKNL